MTRRRSGYAFIAMAAIGWGTWPLVFHHAPMASELSALVLMTVVTAISLPVMLRDRVAVPARAVHWLGIVFLGVADAGNTGLFFAAYQRTTVAIAVLTHYLTPIFVALGARVVLGERLHQRTTFAVIASFGGLVLLLEPWRSGLATGDLVGAALGAGSAVCYASNVLVTKRLGSVFSGSELMFFHGLIGIPILWIWVPRGALAAAPHGSLLVVAVASVVIGALGGLLFVWGLRRSVASHASILTLLEPFIAVVAAAMFLGQGIGPVPVVGGALILIGAVVVVTAKTQTMSDRLGSMSS